MKEPSAGSLASIIRNDENLYSGNLAHYFRAIFRNARNLSNPYHNFRHTFHVTYLCYQACAYYGRTSLTPRQMRSLLIASIFHDFDHSGKLGNDDLNIILAMRGLEKHILDEDRGELEAIKALIMATQYPYVVGSGTLNLSGHIIRDADLSQSLSVAWIQQVVFGLADEWDKKPIDVLRQQIAFTRSLKYETEWAQKTLEPELEGKLCEVNGLLDLLEFDGPPSATIVK
jgi:hypothetical protein